MSRPEAPQSIVQLAEQRARARAAHDWPEADDLRATIEEAGWRVVDAGTGFSLAPARPADVVDGARTIYGSPTSVPSRLDEPPTADASVIVVPSPASIPDAGVADVLAALGRHAPDGTQLIVVVDHATPVETAASDAEMVWTASDFSPGATVQAGLRRSIGRVIVVLESDRLPEGDMVSPLVEVLEDHSVAIAGREGLASRDLRRFQLVPTGSVTALRPGCYAFRRHEAISRGPFDEGLNLASSVAAWWSLVLRDQGADVDPRRAVALRLPLSDRVRDWVLPVDHARKARRDSYRIAARFSGHTWLARRDEEIADLPGDRRGDHDDHDGGHQRSDSAKTQ